ncbi:tRNA-dependent cyclodipeptide synthase [Microbulbifer sp. TRSA005]|uniref:tRNA-dependent cyclodipeptide synthase n=1 Tax=Microbulbifer sp. TRSA005 TaxID=3243383 RepID=UPI0040391B19
MKVEFATSRSQEIYEMADLAVIGISPFNSYFSEGQIARLAKWAQSHFKRVMFFIPDNAAEYTQIALGYEEEKARKRARRQCHYLHNKVYRASGSCAIDSELVDSEWLKQSELYSRWLYQFEQEFHLNDGFREGCLEASRWVLEHHLAEEEVTVEMVSIAVRYLLAELPVILHSADIVGTDSSCFCYHSCPRYLDDLFHESGQEAAGERNGYVIVRNDGE